MQDLKKYDGDNYPIRRDDSLHALSPEWVFFEAIKGCFLSKDILLSGLFYGTAGFKKSLTLYKTLKDYWDGNRLELLEDKIESCLMTIYSNHEMKTLLLLNSFPWQNLNIIIDKILQGEPKND